MLESTIPCPIRFWAIHEPDLPAVQWPGGTLTYLALDRLVDRTAAELKARGVARSDRVGLRLSASERTIVLLAALLRAGAVACPVSARLPRREQLELLERVGIRWTLAGDGGGTGPIDAETLFNRGPAVPDGRSSESPEEVHLRLDDDFTIVFTSGSSGPSKGVLLTVGNHYYSALGSNANIVVRKGDRWLLALPLCHVGGLAVLMRCWLAGAAVVVAGTGRPDPALLDEVRVTHLSLVTTQMLRLMEATEGCRPPSSVRAVLLGGSAIPDRLVERALACGWPVRVSYGLSEMASQVSTTRPEASLDELRHTSGRLLPFREARIGEDGCLFVRGAVRFRGYVTGKGLEQPFDAEGWFATGDVAQADSEGRIRIVGRMDNMFISGGENIHPERIETEMLAIEGVRRALVVPIESEEFGRRPVAVVELDEDGPSRSDLKDLLASRLPRFMLPVAFLAWPPDEPGRLKPSREGMRRYAAGLLAAGSAWA